MLQACQAGDLSWLQQSYQILNILPGVKLDWMEKADYLLTMHPQTDLDYEIIARAIIDHPNLEIMKILHAHHPNFVNMESNSLQTFFDRSLLGGLGT